MMNKKSQIYSRILVLLVGVFLLLPISVSAEYTGEPANVYRGVDLTVPSFSKNGGFYSSAFDLTLTADDGMQIRYTTDGSEPANNSPLYTGPVTVDAPPLSQSPMTSGANIYARSTMNALVVKAAAFSPDGTECSKTITNTYFVDENIENEFSIPVMSISMEPSDFVGGNTGMYLNCYNENLTPQSYMEYYTEDGILGFKHSAQIKISGHGSRGEPKKSLRINFPKGQYEGDGSLLSYDFFPSARQNFYSNEKVTQHGKLTARISDWRDTLIHETLIAAVADPLRPETMTAEPVAIFINGEFWGVYETREQVDNNFIAQHYSGIKKSQVVALAFDWDTANYQYSSTEPLYRVSYDEGPSGAEENWYAAYMEMYNAITQNDLSDKANYDKVMELTDIDNLIDYYLIYMYGDNVDWPGNNYKLWRTVDVDQNVYGHDGKWRYIIHDFDALSFTNADSDSMTYFTTPGSDWDARHPTWATDIYKSLFKSSEFRNRLAARYSTYSGTVFSPERTTEILNDLVKARENDIGHDFYRWNINGGSYDLSHWKSKISGFKFYLNNRSAGVLRSIRNYYNNNFSTGIPSTYTSITFSTNSEQGYFDIAGGEIRPDLYDLEFSSGWTADYMKGLPIEINVKTLEGNKFKYLEINTNGNTEYITEMNYILTPSASDTFISVKAFYETTTIEEKIPTNLKAVRESTDSIKISWINADNVDGVEVYYSTERDGDYRKVLDTVDQSFIHSELTAGVTYYYKLRSFKTVSGVINYSSFTDVEALTLPPLVPAGLSVEKTDYSSLKINWKHVNNADGYEVYCVASSNGSYRIVKDTTDNTYTHQNLTIGNTYYYKIRSYKKVGEERYYSDFSTVNSQTLTIPKPINVKASSAGATAIKLSWNKVSKVSGYAIFRSNTKNGKYKEIKTVNAKKTSYSNKNLTKGKTYYFKVKAYLLVNGSKIYSDSSDAAKYKATLSGPSGIEAKRVNSSSIKISWKKVVGATKYEIYSSTSKKGSYKKIDTVSSKKSSYISKNLEKGKTYYYKIKAVQKIGKKTYRSKYSAVKSAKTM